MLNELGERARARGPERNNVSRSSAPVRTTHETMGTVSTADESARTALTRWLRELPDYVILRNEGDLFDNLARGGDVDLLVGNPQLAERTLIDRLGPPVRITRRSSVVGYSYDWGHIDLLRTVEWRGACYLSTRTVLQSRRLSANGRPVPTVAHEAVISWLTSVLWGGFFKKRYEAFIRHAARVETTQFCQALMEAVGARWGARLCRAATEGTAHESAAWARSLRRALWWRACSRSPLRTIERFVAFVVSELRLRLRPSVPWIALVGADGHDTSSVAKEIIERFATCPYASAKAFRWLPTPHLTAATDWLVAYWTQWVHLRAKGYVVVIEGDLGALVGRTDHRTGPRPPFLLRWLLPQPDLVFILNPRSETFTREPEPLPGPATHKLNTSSSPVERADAVQQLVRAWMLNRSNKSLGLSPTTTSSRATIDCSNGSASGRRL